MKIINIAFLILMLSRCATEIKITDNILEYDNTIGFIEDNDFFTFIDSFKYEASVYNIDTNNIENINITYREYENTNYIGMCTKTSSEVSIQISHNFWSKANYYEKEQLIFHELGHCLLNREHNNDTGYYNNNFVKKSIMSEYLLDYTLYKYYRFYYIEELFAGNDNSNI